MSRESKTTAIQTLLALNAALLAEASALMSEAAATAKVGDLNQAIGTAIGAEVPLEQAIQSLKTALFLHRG